MKGFHRESLLFMKNNNNKKMFERKRKYIAKKVKVKKYEHCCIF